MAFRVGMSLTFHTTRFRVKALKQQYIFNTLSTQIVPLANIFWLIKWINQRACIVTAGHIRFDQFRCVDSSPITHSKRLIFDRSINWAPHAEISTSEKTKQAIKSIYYTELLKGRSQSPLFTLTLSFALDRREGGGLLRGDDCEYALSWRFQVRLW